MSSEQRAALAAWADEGEVPDGLADRVVLAFLSERLGEAEEDSRDDEVGGRVVTPEPRASRANGRLLRIVGIMAAVAAAAAVMLMVRVLPRASEFEDDAALLDRMLEPPSVDPSALPPASVLPDVARLGDEAATVLAQHCSPCHDSTDPEAKPQALDVFDLEQPQWWLTMSDAQLEEARLRVQELGDVTEDERRHVAAFVEVQLRERAHAG